MFPSEWRSRSVSQFPGRVASQWRRRWGRRGAGRFPASSVAPCPARAARRWPGSSAARHQPARPGAGRSPGSSSPSPAETSLASSAPPQLSSAGLSSRRNVSRSVGQYTGAGSVQQPSHHHHTLVSPIVSPPVSPLVSQSLQDYP